LDHLFKKIFLKKYLNHLFKKIPDEPLWCHLIKRKGGRLGKKNLEHDILQNFITYAKEINCFRILFAC